MTSLTQGSPHPSWRWTRCPCSLQVCHRCEGLEASVSSELGVESSGSWSSILPQLALGISWEVGQRG